MKIKRNKRVERNLRIRAARSAGRDYMPALSWQRVRVTLGVPSRKPRSLMTLLEQDIAAQTERLQRLGRVAALEFGGQLVPEPVLETSDEVPTLPPEPESAPATLDGRTDYQYVPSSQRVRRRIIL